MPILFQRWGELGLFFAIILYRKSAASYSERSCIMEQTARIDLESSWSIDKA